MAVTFCLGISFMMSEAKVPDFDTNGLFRALHSHNPAEICGRAVLERQGIITRRA